MIFNANLTHTHTYIHTCDDTGSKPTFAFLPLYLLFWWRAMSCMNLATQSSAAPLSRRLPLPDGRGDNTTRAVIPADWKGVLAHADINGEDVSTLISSGGTLMFGAASVHFPSKRHANDPTDGPVMVVTTPDMTVKLYLESEGECVMMRATE